MDVAFPYKELANQVVGLQSELAKSKRYELVNRTLYRICNAANTTTNLTELLGTIHKVLSSVIDATNFFVAMQDDERNAIRFPYYVNAYQLEAPDPGEQTRFTSLTAEVIRTGQPLLLDWEAIQRYKPKGARSCASQPGGQPLSKAWLGVPLKTYNRTIGAIVVQSYKDPRCYDVSDLEFLASIAKQIAMAIYHKVQEERLKKRETQYQALFESSQLGIIHFSSDGTIIDCNLKAAQILTESTADTLKQQRVTDLFNQKVVLAFQEAVAGKEVVFDDYIQSSDSFPHRYLHITFKPMRVEPVGCDIIATIEDFTEQKRIAESARASDERIRVIFSSLNDAIFVHPYKKQGFAPFIEVNDAACRRYGYTREEFLQLTVMDITDTAEASSHARVEHRQELKDKGRLIFEATHIRKTGEKFPVEISSNIALQFGQPVIIAVARDISERKEAQEEKERLENQLHHAQKMEIIGRLAGGVAHDFNNMLSVILGHTELLLEDLTQGSDMYLDIQSIEQAAQKSSDLTRQLLAFARKQTTEPRMLDITREIEGMLKMLRRLIGEDIDLAWNPEDSAGKIFFDPSQFDQIITNLCINARDAIPGVGKIIISTGCRHISAEQTAAYPGMTPGTYVILSVTDTGCGIPPSSLPYIFEPFYTTKPAGEGTGLGLATVYGILKQNNSFIYAESSDGRPTTFTLFFPKAENFHTLAGNAAQHEETIIRGSANILLVEDEHAILNIVRKMLVKQGFSVLSADCPSKAYSLAKDSSRSIDLLITDVVMPGMNGQTLADRILQLHPGARCLYMSGYATDVIASKEISQKNFHFIQKPFSRQKLLAKIAEVLYREEELEFCPRQSQPQE